MTLREFKLHDRVQLSPACERWMMGDRYGEVVAIGSKLLKVRMDVSGKTIDIIPDRIGEIVERSNT